LTNICLSFNFCAAVDATAWFGSGGVLSDKKSYDHRFYRAWHSSASLSRFELKIEESDLLILCDGADTLIRTVAEKTLRQARNKIKRKIHQSPAFGHALSPLLSEKSDADIIKDMSSAAETWNVGPMAAVAGAVAEAVARAIAAHATAVLVENGGDIFAVTPDTVRFGLYAGEDSPFGHALTFEVAAASGTAICTSSGKIGPSLSFGNADAVVAIHPRGSVADAAATAIANRIRHPSDIDKIMAEAARDRRLSGVIACMGEKLGMWGDIRLVNNP
jgi:uncharacterized protein